MPGVPTLVHPHDRPPPRPPAPPAPPPAHSQLTDPQWWDITGPILDRLFDPAKFPGAARVGAAAGSEHNAAVDPDHALGFGLERILDGIAELIERRREQP